jgi:phage tail-like protein
LATYGIDYYGGAYYGASNPAQFSAVNFLAKSKDYSTIWLTWGSPSGDWSYIRLIRNPYGFAVTADDGDVLFEATSSTDPGFYPDSGQTPNYVGLKAGRAYYYTLFVKETLHNTWQVAGNAIGISVKDYGSTKRMYNSLPEITRSNIPYDTALDSTNDFLYRFIKLFAFQLDLYKTQTENVMNKYDVTNLNGKLIPVFMQEMGLQYEPSIGLKQSRIFLRNAVRLYKNKGTRAGLNEFLKAYAGYDSKISTSKNIMLDFNDSSFEQSIGSWASVSNATLARHSATDSPTITPYNELSSQPNFPNSQKATLQITSVGNGNVIVGLNGDNPIHYGIPVKESTAYTFSGYAQAGTTGRAISAQIYWYDRYGKALTPSSAGSTTNNSTSTWTRFTTSVTAPSGAFFAVPNIKIASTASGETHYFDAFQFEPGSSATYFQDARQLEITLIATRINEIINPNFATPENGWSVTNGTITASSNPDDILAVAGSITNSAEAGEIYASAAGLVTLTSQAIPVFSNNDYTFSIHTAAADSGDAPTSITPYISWYDSTNTLIKTVDGTALTATASLVRPSVTSTAPSSATSAKVGIKWTATAAGTPGTGNQIVVDAALFEKSAFVNAYFDGSNGLAQLSDLFWEGTPNASRSHYYKNRFVIQSRLVSKLPDWINYGSTFELLFAQPNT